MRNAANIYQNIPLINIYNTWTTWRATAAGTATWLTAHLSATDRTGLIQTVRCACCTNLLCIFVWPCVATQFSCVCVVNTQYFLKSVREKVENACARPKSARKCKRLWNSSRKSQQQQQQQHRNPFSLSIPTLLKNKPYHLCSRHHCIL